MGNGIINDEDLLPDYYMVLSVDYYAKPDTIKEAFMALTNDVHTFYKYKEMVDSFLYSSYSCSSSYPPDTDHQICDAFMCLASTGDRASYDAFYFHTPCWYSKAMWLTYRDERRRLDWDDAAKKNTDYLVEIQQAVVEAAQAALAEAATDRPTNGAANQAAKQQAAIVLTKKMHRYRRHRQRKKGRNVGTTPEEKEQEKKKQEKGKKDTGKEVAEQQKKGLDGKSDSGQSDFTLIEAIQASPIGGAAEIVNGSVAAAVAAVRREENRADNPIHKLPAHGTPVTPTRAADAGKAQHGSTAFHRKPAPKMSAVTLSNAGSVTNRAAGRAAASRPEQLKTTPTRLACPSITRPAISTTRPGHVPAHTKHPAAAAAGPIGLTDKAASSTTTRPTRATRSTATAMMASATSKARPAQRPALGTGKQLVSTKPPGRPTAPAASATIRVSASPSQNNRGTLVRVPPPKNVAPSVQKKSLTATTDCPMASGHSSTLPHTAAAPVASTFATAPDCKSNAPTTSIKKGMMANSRWANPQTCANGRPGHPQTLSNWKRLPRLGKCTTCGCASPGTSTTASTRHLYWCGMCDVSFCNECFIGKVLRRQ